MTRSSSTAKWAADRLQVAQLLRQAGFKNAKSMAGGILLWNKDVEPERSAVLIEK